MKKKFLGIFTLALIMSAAFWGKAVPINTLTTSAQNTDFDCNYGLPDKSDPFFANTYGATKIVTYTQSEAATAGLPSGFSGDVLSVEHTAVNRGITLDFSEQKIPTKLIESITFIVTSEGDTADVVIDEEALCPDLVESERSEEPTSSNTPESSEEIASSKTPEESELESSQQKQSQENTSMEQSESGCGSALVGSLGMSSMLLGACALFKRKKK